MTEHQEKDLDIKDLPPEETLTPEEKEQLAGAGRFRPMLEALETREMMDAGLGGAIMAPMAPIGGGAAPAVGNVRTLDAPAPAIEVVMPAEVLQDSGANSASISTSAPGNNSALTTGGIATTAAAEAEPATTVETPAANGSPGSLAATSALASTAAAPAAATTVAMAAGNHSTTPKGTPTQPAYLGASDASAAVPVTYDGNKEGVLVGDDKSDVIRLYDKAGGNIVDQWDFRSKTGSQASDIEAAARVNNTIYWMTSSGKVFVTEMTPAGLEFVKTVDLNNAIKEWGKNITVSANGEAMTLAQAMDKNDKNYFNIEAFAIGPDGTAYIGFRAPLSDKDGKALLLPVTNFQKLMSGEAKTAEFGKLITLGFEGRGIRDIVWSQDMGKFLILAGNYGVGPGQNLSTRLFAWDGPGENGIYKSDGPNTKVTFLKENGTDPEGKYMSYEAIGRIKDLGGGNWQVQLLSDDGGSLDHGKKYQDKKTERPFNERYFYGEFVTFSL